MKVVTVFLFFLISCITLESQSVTFTGELRPFRINRVVVTDLLKLKDFRVVITGRTVYGEEVPLFISKQVNSPEELECFFYFDDSIQNLTIEVSSSSTTPELFEYSTQTNPYRLTVFASSELTLSQLPGYTIASTSKQLRPGDVFVLGESGRAEIQGSDIEGFLKRGIHVIGTGSLKKEDKAPHIREQSPWTGRLLILDSLDSTALTQLLDSRRREFSEFKRCYYDLIAKANFYGISTAQKRTLIFINTRVEDIAVSLEQRYLTDRPTLFHKLLLLGFYLPVLILVGILRKTKLLVIPLAVLLSLFIFISVLVPDRDKSLQLLLNSVHLTAEEVELVRNVSNGRATMPLHDLFPSPVEEQRFNAADYVRSNWTVAYNVFRSSRKEIPLETFKPAAAVKFNQIPRIERDDGVYFLKFLNPLRSWSLHEPE